jgi:HAD superfamily phosphoserine phosphatase-like hydrolase
MTIRLAAFDLDGTLTHGPTVCQVLAEPLGQRARMDAIERLHDQQAIRAARHEMAGWYQGRTVEQLCACLDPVTLATGVDDGFALLKRHRVQTAIVSITWSFAVDWFARRLGADFAVGTALAPNGQIRHVWPDDKAAWVADPARHLGIALGDVAAVGDSAGDLPMLATVGLPIFVGRSLPAGMGPAVHQPEGDIAEVARRIISPSDPSSGAAGGPQATRASSTGEPS